MNRKHPVLLECALQRGIGRGLHPRDMNLGTASFRDDVGKPDGLHHGKIARFLEAQGYKEAALLVAIDPEHRFDLALQLEKVIDIKLFLLFWLLHPK